MPRPYPTVAPKQLAASPRQSALYNQPQALDSTSGPDLQKNRITASKIDWTIGEQPDDLTV